MAVTTSVKSVKTGADGKAALIDGLGLVGIASTFASIACLFICEPPASIGLMECTAFRLAAALSMLVTFAVVNVISEWIYQTRAKPLTALVAVGLLCWVAFTLAYPYFPIAANITLVCISSAGLAAMVTMQFNFACCKAIRCSITYISFAILIALCLCCVVMLLAPVPRVALLVSFYATSLAIHGFERSMGVDDDERVRVGREESRRRSRIKPESVIMLMVANIQFGYIVSLTSARELIVIVIVAAAATLVLALDSVSKHWISEASMNRPIIPLTVVVFATMFLFGDIWKLITLGLLAVIVAYGIIFGWVALSAHVRLTKLSTVFAFSRARIIDYAGIAIGLLAGAFVARLFENSAMMAMQASAIITCIYALISSYFQRSRFPEASIAQSDVWNEAKDGANVTAWKRRCYIAGEQYGLSERQYEVMCLLTQGRNAEYVAKELIISVSTAQTHIRNIYRKMDIHSRQELFDLIENIKLYEEDE